MVVWGDPGVLGLRGQPVWLYVWVWRVVDLKDPGLCLVVFRGFSLFLLAHLLTHTQGGGGFFLFSCMEGTRSPRAKGTHVCMVLLYGGTVAQGRRYHMYVCIIVWRGYRSQGRRCHMYILLSRVPGHPGALYIIILSYTPPEAQGRRGEGKSLIIVKGSHRR